MKQNIIRQRYMQEKRNINHQYVTLTISHTMNVTYTLFISTKNIIFLLTHEMKVIIINVEYRFYKTYLASTGSVALSFIIL